MHCMFVRMFVCLSGGLHRQYNEGLGLHPPIYGEKNDDQR